MANNLVPTRNWVGEPKPVADRFCPECVLPSLVEVPYYATLGEVADQLISGDERTLMIKRRISCRTEDCGWAETKTL